jgi:4-hydroxybenzoate polyprenyltransferase
MLKRLKAVSDFYLYSNLHIALCVVAMVLSSQLIFGYHLRSELYVFVFCGTFFLYNLQRLPSAFAKVKIESEFIRHKWNTEHKVFLAVISGLAGIAAGWSFFQLYHRSQLIALLPAALSFAYAFPFIKLKGRWRKLRDIEVMKIFIIALVWGIICTMLPATANDPSGKDWHALPVLIWFVACSMMIFAITVPFDIRDYYYDGDKLRTIPVILGVKKAILLAVFLQLVSVLLFGVLTIYYEKGGWPVFAGYAAWSVLVVALISKSSPDRKEYYFSFLVDGIMLLLPGFIFLAQQLYTSKV